MTTLDGVDPRDLSDRGLLVAIINLIIDQENRMSQIDTSLARLDSDLADLVATHSEETAAFLAQVQELQDLNDQLASDDQTDADSIAALTTERDNLLDQIAEAAAKIDERSSQIEQLVAQQSGGATGPTGPTGPDEPAPADV
jgi:peptidoglycan hydrolase CwlO-like protein